MSVYVLKVEGKLSAGQLDQLLSLWRQVMGDTPVTVEELDTLRVVDQPATVHWPQGPWPWGGKA